MIKFILISIFAVAVNSSVLSWGPSETAKTTNISTASPMESGGESRSLLVALPVPSIQTIEITAGELTTYSIQVKWEFPGSQTFYVQIRESQLEPLLEGSLIQQSSHTFQGLVSGRMYFIHVTAYVFSGHVAAVGHNYLSTKAIGKMQEEQDSSARSLVVTTPGLNLRAGIVTSTSIEVFWNKLTVSGYLASLWIGSDLQAELNLGVNATGAIFQGLQVNTKYEINVWPIDAKEDVLLTGISVTTKETSCDTSRWSYISLCERGTKYTYEITRNRSISCRSASRGSSITRSEESKVSCSESQFIASSILKAATHILKSNSPSQCLTDFYDENGVRRMVGNTCKNNRGIRPSRAVLGTNAPKDRDVLFLIDESGSVGSQNFPKFMKFVAAMTDLFSGNIGIGQFKTRVAVKTFDEIQRHRVDFDKYFSKKPLVNHMKNDIQYTGPPTSSKTCILDALECTRNRTFIRERGARVFANGNSILGVGKLVIMLTDGCSNCNNYNMDKLAQLLKQEGFLFNENKYSFVTITVGNPKNGCLSMFQNLDIGSACYTTYSASDFNQIEDWTRALKVFKAWGLSMNEWIIGDSC